MNGVEHATLSSIAEIVRGVTFSKKDTSVTPDSGLVPVLRAGNIQGELLLNDDLLFVPEKKISVKQKLRAGDIVMCTSSGSADVIGKSAFLENDWNGAFGAFCAAIRANSRACLPRYLFHYLQTPMFRDWTRNSSGANIKNIRKSELNRVSVPLPSINEQRRIAGILDKADAIRRKRDQFHSLSENFLQSAYHHIVGSLNPKFSDWKPHSIEQLASDRKGSIRSGPFGSALRHSEFVDEGVAVLGIDNAVTNMFGWGERRYITDEKFEQLRRYRVFPGDVIVTIMGTVGRSAVVPHDIPKAITSKHLATITCEKTKILPEVLACSLQADSIIKHQIRAQNKGAIMDGLNLRIIRQLVLRRPPMGEQRRFVRIFKKIKRMRSKIDSSSGNGSDLLASLSQRAFRDEL